MFKERASREELIKIDDELAFSNDRMETVYNFFKGDDPKGSKRKKELRELLLQLDAMAKKKEYCDTVNLCLDKWSEELKIGICETGILSKVRKKVMDIVTPVKLSDHLLRIVLEEIKIHLISLLSKGRLLEDLYTISEKKSEFSFNLKNDFIQKINGNEIHYIDCILGLFVGGKLCPTDEENDFIQTFKKVFLSSDKQKNMIFTLIEKRLNRMKFLDIMRESINQILNSPNKDMDLIKENSFKEISNLVSVNPSKTPWLTDDDLFLYGSGSAESIEFDITPSAVLGLLKEFGFIE